MPSLSSNDLVDGGGYATRVVAHSALTFAVPAGLDLHAAAELPEALFTCGTTSSALRP